MSHMKEKRDEAHIYDCRLYFGTGGIPICFFLFANGLPAIGEIGCFKFLFGKIWRPSNGIYGIFPMIVASIYVTGGAILFGVPIALLTSVFMARYCPKKSTDTEIRH